MKNFYTIIKISPNTTVGDTVSIGLLAIDDHDIWFRISDDKKHVVKMFFENPETVDFAVGQLTTYLGDCQKSDRLDNSIHDEKPVWSPEYLDHLSQSFNGVLRFSSPSEIRETLNKENFDKLFSLLITGQKQKVK